MQTHADLQLDIVKYNFRFPWMPSLPDCDPAGLEQYDGDKWIPIAGRDGLYEPTAIQRWPALSTPTKADLLYACGRLKVSLEGQDEQVTLVAIVDADDTRAVVEMYYGKYALVALERITFTPRRRYLPKEGQEYCYVNDRGVADCAVWKANSGIHDCRYVAGNCFATIEEAHDAQRYLYGKDEKHGRCIFTARPN